MTSRVVVLDYDPRWAIEFSEIREILQNALGDVDIQHVGSTSVPELAAKPILDIDIIINSWDEAPEIIRKLAQLGYTHEGDLGIPEREAFKRNSDFVPYAFDHRRWMNQHLYLCRKGCLSLQNHLNLRNYLRTHPESVEEYSLLKKDLAARFPSDIDSYISGKTAFISKILFQTGMKQSEIQDIADQNK